MEEKWSIEKLDGNNWNTWKFQMKHLLVAKGLWNLVDGSEVYRAPVAQLVEHRVVTREVVSSTPARPTLGAFK